MATYMEKIRIVIMFVLCGFAVGNGEDEVSLKEDVPFLSARVYDDVELKCCFETIQESVTYTWVKHFRHGNSSINATTIGNETETKHKSVCGKLTLKSVQLVDSGLYQCHLMNIQDGLYTHGTYLQVYKPLYKTINLSESTKNKILTAEGILLLLCVLLPSATLLFKSKRVNALEKKKVKKEEENIYQGLNLDDCCATYDKIERSQTHGPYQDVCNIIEEEEDIQLEKP